jgi:hypothetical protein
MRQGAHAKPEVGGESKGSDRPSSIRLTRYRYSPTTGVLSRETCSVPCDPTLTREEETEPGIPALATEMFGHFVASEYGAAHELARQVIERMPDHTIARLVEERCREELGVPDSSP